MRAHGAAVRAYRSEGAHEIGLVVNIEPKYPASDSPADLAAAARAHASMNRQYLDAALKGRYPAEMAEIFGEAWPDWPEQDLRDICQPLDFRSEARSVGKAWVSTCRSRWAPEHTKKK